MKSRMEEYLNAAISGNTENLPNPVSRIDFLLCELIKTLGESGASIEEVEKIVTDKVAEIVADAPKDFDTLKELSDWIYTHEESAAAMNTAIQSNTNSIESLMTDVNKKANSDDVYDKATADSRFLGIDATADKAVADENGSNISETFSTMKNDIAINRTTLGYQCKNLLKNNAVTKTINGVTFTVNSDGSVTVNGTNTSSGTTYIQLCGFVDYGNSKLIASIGQNTTDVYMAIYDSNWNWIGTGSAGTISFENSSKKRLVRLVVKPGVTINNVTVYPMLRYADITDSTYEPYKESVDERITKNTSDITVNKSTLGYQRKNLLKNTAVTKTVNGVTFTVNDDKSITVSGTNNSSYTVFYNVCKTGELTLENDKSYIMTGCPENNKSSDNKTLCYLRADSSIGVIASDTGSGVTFTTSETSNPTYVLIYVSANADFTDNPVTFYPIIRYADIIDDTYEPYQPSLQEQISALISRIEALENNSTA